MEEFYVIIRDRQENRITKRHTDIAEAMREAERLSRQERDRFFVLKAIWYVQPASPPIEWVAITDRDPLPAQD